MVWNLQEQTLAVREYDDHRTYVVEGAGAPETHLGIVVTAAG